MVPIAALMVVCILVFEENNAKGEIRGPNATYPRLRDNFQIRKFEIFLLDCLQQQALDQSYFFLTMQQQGPQTWKKWASAGIILWAIGLQARHLHNLHVEFNSKYFSLNLVWNRQILTVAYFSNSNAG
jgi:hypothetical protein